MYSFTPEERLKLLTNFWGCGNPSETETLFIGIEEGGNWEDYLGDVKAMDRRIQFRDSKYIQKRDFYHLDNSWYEAISPTEQIQLYISMKLRGINPSGLEDKKLFNRDIAHVKEFTANLFPIARPKVSARFSSALKTALNIGADYPGGVIKHRAAIMGALVNEIKRYNPDPLIIIMGKSIWNDNFRFNLLRNAICPNEKFNIYYSDGKHEFGCSLDGIKRGNVVLLSHPTAHGNHRLTEQRMETIFQQLFQKGRELPDIESHRML